MKKINFMKTNYLQRKELLPLKQPLNTYYSYTLASFYTRLPASSSLNIIEEQLMATITFKGSPIHTAGKLPTKGSKADSFTLTKTNLEEVTLNDFAGKKVILNIFPSIDTPTCATSVRKFNAEAGALDNTVVLCVSLDLPFAQARFCGAEGLDKVIPVSAFRHPEFAEKYGVKIIDSPLAGLFSRAIVIINAEQNVIYTEQVAEIADEPNYAAALAALA
jgi:thiol peroxidase